MNNINIYQIILGTNGEYVFAATSYEDLYQRINDHNAFKWEILRNKANTNFLTYEEFLEAYKNHIRVSPMHLGYLGGYSE